MSATPKDEEVPPEVSPRVPRPVQGFMFASESDYRERKGTICKIVRRTNDSEANQQDLIEGGPAFVVRFGDGEEIVAYWHQLNPWYPT